MDILVKLQIENERLKIQNQTLNHNNQILKHLLLRRIENATWKLEGKHGLQVSREEDCLRGRGCTFAQHAKKDIATDWPQLQLNHPTIPRVSTRAEEAKQGAAA